MNMYGDDERLPMVSIITPSLNRGAQIETCIASVRTQTYRQCEHIIADGGSTDQTLAILKKYPHLKWISEPDEGMYDAVNKGIGLAQGDIIAYLNCDDRYFPDTLATVVAAFRRHPRVDFVYGYCAYINENEEELYFMRSIPFNSFLMKRMRRVPWAQPSTFWRRRVHNQIGLFNPTYKLAGDFDFFLRMLMYGLHGKLIRRKLCRFMLSEHAYSFSARDSFWIEGNDVLGKISPYVSLQAKVSGSIGEILFKLSNLDNYIRRGRDNEQRSLTL